MDDETFKRELRTLYNQDIERRLVIDQFVDGLAANGLFSTFTNYISEDIWTEYNLKHHVHSKEDDTVNHVQFHPLLIELYKHLAKTDPVNARSHSGPPSLEVIRDFLRSDRCPREEIGTRILRSKHASQTSPKRPEPTNEMFMDVPQPVTTFSAINDWPSHPGVPKSLRGLSEAKLMKDIQQSVGGAKATAAFCCGGSVAFTEKPLVEGDRCPSRTGPVRLRWDDEQNGPGKIVFSGSSYGDSNFADALARLCEAAQPAPFGRGDQSVLDDSYRRATKLDETDFTTNFHPHTCGILAELERVLLPSYLHAEYRAHDQRVFAELYKLNVYSGPGGHFKSHVDTPRSDTHFASLVVCLPAIHEGGELVVTHNGRSIEFDWSSKAPDRIHWAAFYSDCEHKIMPLKSGHRVTLTYNLFYRSTQPGRGDTLPMPLNSFSIYHDLQAALKAPGFMKRGGILGFGCNHVYAHCDVKLRRELPMAMKGIDLLIYAACRALGLSTKARPILERSDLENWHDDDFGEDPCAQDELDDAARRRLQGFQKDGSHSYKMSDPRSFPNIIDDSVTPETKLSLKYQPNDGPLGKQIESYAPDEVGSKREYLKRHMNVAGLVPSPRVELVGSRFHKLRHLEYVEENGDDIMKEEWPNDIVSGIQWVTPLQHWELALTFMTYGNEATSETRYSAAAILVVIPPWSPERGQVEGDGEATFSVEQSSSGKSEKSRRGSGSDGYRDRVMDTGEDDGERMADREESKTMDALSPPRSTADFHEDEEEEEEEEDDLRNA